MKKSEKVRYKRFFALMIALTIMLSSYECVYAEETNEKMTQEVQTQEAQTQETQTQEPQPQEVQTQEVQTQETQTQEAQSIEVGAPSAILMEASTGTVIFEKNPDELLHPASITKIMTILLIFDALKEGKIQLSDDVSVSEYAASMGGSQVFLEPFEKQTVKTMLKCIAVASANDASVAMAEYICGSEDEFVKRMNERAVQLGMTNTHFKNCNGLDVEGHMTTARDVALMSRELITKYPEYEEYSMIWMENITHTTAKGSSEFGLTNTNKLVKQYAYTTGLKTGSTSLAKYCVSATARHNEIDLIAVIMAADDHQVRFKDAVALLNYGFGVSTLYRDENHDIIPLQPVKGGKETEAEIVYTSMFSFLAFKGENINAVSKELRIQDYAKAPLHKGDIAGEAVYMIGNKEIGRVPLVYAKTIEEAGYGDYMLRVLRGFLI